MISVLLLGAVIAFIIINSSKEDGAFVKVTDGENVTEYSLFENGEYPLAGGKNILVIEGGVAYIKSADCPDKLCVKYGKISKSGERIVCLPNKVMIEVFGEDEEVLVP